MSEANPLIDNLNRRVTELSTELAETRAEAKKYRLAKKTASAEADQLKAQVLELTADRDAWKGKAEAAPSELQTRVDELTGQLRDRDHSDAWRATVGDQIADKVPLADVWAKLDYKPGDKVPAADEIKATFAKLADVAPYYLKQAGQGAGETPSRGGKGPALETQTQGGRGAPDTSTGRVAVRASDLRNPKFALDPANKKMIADAKAAGTYLFIED